MTDPGTRQELAREWIRSTAELRSMADSATPARTLFQRARARRATRRFEAHRWQLHEALQSTRRDMEYLSFGADPHEWGALSGGALVGDREVTGSFILEDALNTLAWPNEGTAHQARSLLTDLPDARAAAELGDDSARAAIETRLLALSESPGLEPGQRRRLIEHLPARLRPIPASLEDLDSLVSERGPSPVTLYLQGHDERNSFRSRIELQDIIVDHRLRGKGIGTAALIELIRYADLHGLPIEGILEPGPYKPAETVAPLAGWYARLGFTQGDREPHQWRRGGTIHRPPTQRP